MEPYQLNQLIIPSILFVFALAIRATLSFLETSITALRLFRLKELAHSTTQYKPLLQTLEKNPQRILITIIVATNLVDVTSASLGTFIMGHVFTHLGFSSGMGFTFGIAFATIGIIIFGEILPKSFAKVRSEQGFKSMLWLINGVYFALYPLVTILSRLSEAVMYRLGGKNALESGSQWVSSEREIQFLINYIHEKGLLELEKREMLQNIFALGSTPAKEVMVPATNIISLEIDTPIEKVFDFFSHYSYTRMPVYEKKQDNIVGMIHQKDLFIMFSKNEQKTLHEMIRPIMFVPESMKVNQLLGKFREQQMHIGVVINEHGIITGLITLEDIIEEIVGEINDEHEPIMGKIIPLEKDQWITDATISLEDLEAFLETTFPREGSAVSLAGFLTELLGHIPQKDENVSCNNFLFHIQKATPVRVQLVHITKQ